MGALMIIGPGALIVIALYGMCLYVIWYVSPRLPGAESEPRNPWWRSTRFWASFVAIAQIVTYALFA
jgi:hypothetical protein